MKTLHSPHHWITVTLVAAAALLTLSDVYGQQRNDAGAMFQGRPAMAGAQSGTGPMAGPPQGGLGVQGSENTGVALRPPPSVRKDGDAVTRDRDTGVAKEQRSPAKKAKRTAKRTASQARHGVASIGE